MAQLNFEITNHPAQAQHPFTKAPLFDENDNPVPLFPDDKALRLDGRIIAYIIKDGSLSFILPESVLTAHVIEKAREFAGDESGKSQIVADLVDLEETDEFDDE